MPILKHKTITKLLLSLATFAPIFLTFSSPALANPYETTLKNGLRIIVKEDRRAPTVAHMVWYKVGSMDEVDGTSGVAHVLEHMMFKGTPKVGPVNLANVLLPLVGATMPLPAMITPLISNKFPKKNCQK